MIAVVVINYRDEQRTIDFVRNELSKISLPYRVIIVDNGSTPDSAAALKSVLEPSGAVVLTSSENLGFACGNNLGAEYARDNFRPEQILFANNDIRFTDTDVVDKMAEKLSAVKEAGVIGPKVVGLDGKLQSPSPFIPFLDRHVWIYWTTPFTSRAWRNARFSLDYAEMATEGFHYIVSGCFFMVDARDFFECGEMDPNTFLYGEEMILSERMKKIGKQIYYLPSAAVVHEHGMTTTKYYNTLKIRQMKLESDSYYYRNYIGTPRWQIALARFTYFLKRIFSR